MTTIKSVFKAVDPYMDIAKDCLTVIGIVRYSAILLGKGGAADTLKAVKSPFIFPCLIYKCTTSTYKVSQECSMKKSFVAANIGVGVLLLSAKVLQNLVRLETTKHFVRRSLKVHLLFTQLLLAGFAAKKAHKEPKPEQIAILTHRTLSVVKQGLKEVGASEVTRAGVGLVKGVIKIGVSINRRLPVAENT